MLACVSYLSVVVYVGFERREAASIARYRRLRRCYSDVQCGLKLDETLAANCVIEFLRIARGLTR